MMDGDEHQDIEGLGRAVTGHGIAVVALQVARAGDVVAVLLMQCECGWRERFAEVTTADAITGAAERHRAKAAPPDDPEPARRQAIRDDPHSR